MHAADVIQCDSSLVKEIFSEWQCQEMQVSSIFATAFDFLDEY